jgi:uncharacterized protein YjbJ (UPF0337 family)
MNSDNLKGNLKDLGGKIKQGVGESTGNADLEAEGRGDQAEGKVQNAWGNVKKEARDLKEDIKGAVNKNDRREDVA